MKIYILRRLEAGQGDEISKFCIEAHNENAARAKASFEDGDRWMHESFAFCSELSPDDPEWETLERLGLVKSIDRNFEGG